MRRWVWGLVATVAVLASCGKAPVPVPRQVPAPAPALYPAASPWPDATAPLLLDGGRHRDAAVVVAIERYPSLPEIRGARLSGVEWAGFLARHLRVPRERVAILRDGVATKANILGALATASRQVEPGGRLWFIFIGHGGEDVVPFDGGDARLPAQRLSFQAILGALANAPAQPFIVLDTGFDETLTKRLRRPDERILPEPATWRSPVVIEGGESGFLPHASRPAFSYLLLGALRGWGDADQDGFVTVREAFEFTTRALLMMHSGFGVLPKLASAVECRSLTTLSASHEKAPDLTAIVSPSPPLGGRGFTGGDVEPRRRWGWTEGRSHYAAAEKATDAAVARCEWSESAKAYEDELHVNPVAVEKAEAALNGAYAFRQAGHFREAAAMYRAYVLAQAHAVPGDDKKTAEVRHTYTVSACSQFLELVVEKPALLPAYSDLCLAQDWLTCEEGDVADCAGICPAAGKVCARWADHAEAGIGVPRDAAGALRVRKVSCARGDRDACRKIAVAARAATPQAELDEMRDTARAIENEAAGLEELSGWETGDAQREQQRAALDRYRAAEEAFRAVVERRASDLDAAGSLLGFARVRYSSIALRIAMGETPGAEDIAAARTAAQLAVDACVGERQKEAAHLLVDLADRALESQLRDFERSHGARGIELRTELQPEDEGGAFHVASEPLPPAVADAVRARDEYVTEVAPVDDPEGTRSRHALEAAHWFFVYGELEEARPRLERLYTRECGLSSAGYEASGLFLGTLYFQNDAVASRKVGAGPSCAVDPETRWLEEAFRKPVLAYNHYLDCPPLFEKALRLPDGPERRTTLREATACVVFCLSGGPLRDEAPGATLRAADAYVELGETRRAIELYESFVSKYASEQTLLELEKGAPGARPPIPPRPDFYRERLAELPRVYDALASLYVGSGDYRRAALLLEAESANARLSVGLRRAAARRAMTFAGWRGASGMLRRLHRAP